MCDDRIGIIANVNSISEPKAAIVLGRRRHANNRIKLIAEFICIISD